MGDAFIGEIRTFSFNYPPEGWLVCDGQELQAVAYAPLYAVIGNRFGGQYRQTFKLPDLRGLASVGAGTAPGGQAVRQLGTAYGAGEVTLTQAGIPSHTHQMVRPGGSKVFAVKFSEPSSIGAPGSLAISSNVPINGLRTTGAPDVALAPAAVATAGGGQPHDNRQPYLVLNFCICVVGNFPVKP